MGICSRLCACVVLIVLTSGCWKAFYGDFAHAGHHEKIALDKVRVGDTKDQVRSALGKPHGVPGARQTTHGLVEAWSYVEYRPVPGPDEIERETWIYFMNDTVSGWGLPGDWPP